MKNKKGSIIIISGPSGVGKGSVNNILKGDNHLKIEYSISMTTRKPREGEINGVHYFFVTEQEFNDAITKNELIEHASFVGNLYGTPRKYVNEQLEKGKNVILEIEVNGATQVLRKEKNAISIFLMPPTLDELASRIRGRQSEDDEVIKKRLDKALLEIPLKHNYKYVVENDNIKNAAAKITDILEKEGVAENEDKIVYEKLEDQIREVVRERYCFFVDNWEHNVRLLCEDTKQAEKQLKDFDAEVELVKILTKNLYHKVLEHGDFRNLEKKDFIIEQIQRLMFKINFFSIEQKGFE